MIAFARAAVSIAALAATLTALSRGPARAADRRLGASVAKPSVAGASWSARQKRRLARDLDALLAGASTMRGAHAGLLAIDTRSGDVLYTRNSDDAFTPASTMKVVTGSAALALLGPAYRFRTEAYLAPPSGALVIRAGGDPLLGRADLAALARAAFAAGGFRSPSAPVIDLGAFDLAPYPPGWSSDDFPYDYAAKLTPIPVDENAVNLTLAPGPNVGAPLDIGESGVPLGVCEGGVPLATHLNGTASDTSSRASSRCSDGSAGSLPIRVVGTTGAAGTPAALDLVRDPTDTCTAVVGSLPLGGEPQTLGAALLDPLAYVDALVGSTRPKSPSDSGSHHALSHPSGRTSQNEGWRSSRAGARNSSPVPARARLIWSLDGEPLSDLVADMWWPSDNFIAEMLLRAIGRNASGMPGTTDHGAAAERRWLTSLGIDAARVTITDGSGMSVYDRLTPRALVAILQADWNGPDRDIALDDLPLAGVRGTLARSFLGTLAEGHTFAKTGSVTHARGLAGYLATLRHGAVTFAWLIDDWQGESDGLDALRAHVLSRIIGD